MKLSVCMMVKNEAELLAEAMESVRLLADEFVIVDTGSTDNTIDVIEGVRARWKNEPEIRIFHEPWRDDFSWMRNFAMSKATGDWLFIIDADERLRQTAPTPISAIGWKKWVDSIVDKFGAMAFEMVDWQKGIPVMKCNSVRMFRRDRAHYENIVHNLPIIQGEVILCMDYQVHHIGYDLSPEKMEEKYQRSRGLLLKQLETRPEYKQSFFYLMELTGMHNEVEESIEWGEKYLECRQELNGSFNKSVYYSMIKNYHRKNEFEKANELIKQAFADGMSNDPDIAAALADHGARTNNMIMMAEGARRHLKGVEEERQDPGRTKSQRFYFTLRESIEDLNLYRLFMVDFSEAINVWKRLKTRMNHVPEKVRAELERIITDAGMAEAMLGKESEQTETQFEFIREDLKTIPENRIN